MMKVFISIIIIVLAILVGAAFYFLNYAIVRGRKEFDVSDLSQEEQGAWAEYMPKIREGIDWLKGQPFERVEIKSRDGLTLVGYMLIAKEAKGTILMMHGYRSSAYSDFSCAAEYLYSLGYNLLMPNQRANGESEGKYIGFGVLERYDCLGWIEYINQRVKDNLPIVLDGISMGAATVLMASGLKLPMNVKGIIADCGFTSPWNIFTHVLKRSYKLPKFPVLYTTSLLSRVLAGYGFQDYSTVEALKNNKLPVLFVHGNKDSFVPSYMSEVSYKITQGPKKLVIVDGAQHGTSYLTDMPLYKRELKEFFHKYVETAF